MAEKKVKIKFETNADTKGADETSKALDQVADSQKKVADAPPPRTLQEALNRGKMALQESVEASEELAKVTPKAVDATNDQTEALEKQAEAADEASIAVRKLTDEEKRLQEQQRKADVEVARQRLSDRNANSGVNTPLLEGRESLAARAAGAGAILATAKTSLAAVSETIRAYQVLRQEVGGATTDQEILFGALADTMEIISSPLDAIKNGLKSIAGLDDLEDAIERAKQTKFALDEIIRTRKELYDQAYSFSLASAYQREREEIDNQTAALQRQLQVLKAKRELISVQADETDRQQAARGEDPNVIAANRVVRDAASSTEALADELKVAEDRQKKANLDAQQAVERLKDIQQSGGGGTAEAIAKAELEVQATGNAVTEVGRDIESLKQQIDIQGEIIRQTAETSLQGLTSDASKGFTDAANLAIQTIQAKAQEQGGQLSSLAQQSLDQLVAVIKDGIPDAKQLPLIQQAMQNFRVSQEGNNQIVFEVITAILNQLEIANRNYRQVLEKVNEMGRQNRTMTR